MSATVSDKDGEIKLLLNKAKILELDNIDKIIEEFSSLKVRPRGQFNSYYKKDAGSPTINASKNKSIGLAFKDSVSTEVLEEIKSILLQYPGSDNIFVKVKINGEEKIIKLDILVEASLDLKNKLISDFSNILDVV